MRGPYVVRCELFAGLSVERREKGLTKAALRILYRRFAGGRERLHDDWPAVGSRCDLHRARDDERRREEPNEDKPKPTRALHGG